MGSSAGGALMFNLKRGGLDWLECNNSRLVDLGSAATRKAAGVFIVFAFVALRGAFFRGL